MNRVIQQKIESVEAINQRMNNAVSQTISMIFHELPSTDISIHESSKTNNISNSWNLSTIGMISGAALLAGSVGWFVTGSLWTKVLFWGGGIGLASDIILKKGSKTNGTPHNETYKTSLSISVLKQSASQKILSAIENVSSLWENLTNSNKEQLLTLIDNSSLSSNEKFNASSYVSVTKTLEFELLKIQNLIDSAKSIIELKSNVSNIHSILKDKIDTVSNLQIDSYRQVNKILEGA